MAAAAHGVMALIRQQGVRLLGDEPHYLVAAEALGRFHSLTVGRAYQFAVSNGMFLHWSKPPIEQTFSNHDAPFAFHNLGLPALVAIPTWIDNQYGAEVGLALIVAALTVWLGYLIASTSHIRSPWSICITGLFLSPAFLLASTQFYPDLLSGLFIAIVIMVIARMEARKRSSRVDLVCSGLLLGYLPWLHTQNIIFGVVLAAALAVAYLRTGGRIRSWELVTTLGLTLVIWVLFAWYNLYVFGSLGGPPGETFSLGITAWTRVLALLFDSQQGLLVQFPVILLGLAAMWVLRRRLPVAVISTLVVVVAVILPSGSFDNSFGGSSFVGRFQWSASPILLSFAGIYLLRLFRARRGVATAFCVGIAALYVGQLIPILLNDHLYYSYEGLGPQPPGGGWWGPLDHFLPSFNELGTAWLSPRFVSSVVCLILLFGLIVTGLVRLVSKRSPRAKPSIVVLLAATVVSGCLVVIASAQVMTPQTFPAKTMPSQVGYVSTGKSRTVRGPETQGALVFGPGWEFPAGSYQVTIYYRLNDPNQQAAPFDAILASTRPSQHQVNLTKGFLPDASSGTKTISFDIPKNRQLFVRVFWQGSGSLTVSSYRIVQTSN